VFCIENYKKLSKKDKKVVMKKLRDDPKINETTESEYETMTMRKR
jgi:hypothetical protein